VKLVFSPARWYFWRLFFMDGFEESEEQPKALGGPFDQSNVDKPYELFVQGLLNQPGTQPVNCKSVRKSGKDAGQLTAREFDLCYYGQTDKKGHSLELRTPVMYPATRLDAQGDPKPEPRMKKLPTIGDSKVSRRIDVYEHALPAVLPVSYENGKKRGAGTATMISEAGLMVTNHHVIEDSNGTLKVKMLRPDGTEEERIARVVFDKPEQDLALLQVDHEEGDKFAFLPISQSTRWQAGEVLVEMGNANGEGKISMAMTHYGTTVSQRDLDFGNDSSTKAVLPDRTLYRLDDATVPHGYSGGVVLSVPGSTCTSEGVTREGTSAIRGITGYSNFTNTSYIIPAATVQSVVNEYREQASAHTNKS
jgi:S1-C subfamily serine protease